MISRFSFQNFRSYKSETVFDFQAASIPEFNDSLIKREKVSSLLPVSVIYGPNGGGKSNFLRALICLISIVTAPIYQFDKNRKKIFQQFTINEPYMFDEFSQNEPTVFDLFFRTKKNEFRYYISIKHNNIIDECLYRRSHGGKKTATIFERSGNIIKLGASLKSASLNTEINPKMPYFSFLAINYNLPVIIEAVSQFESSITVNYGNYKTDATLFGASLERQKNNIIRLMHNMGIDISNYIYDDEREKFYVYRNIRGKEYELKLSSESSGTRKLFSVLPLIIMALEEGRLVIVDELDAKLHPKLLEYIISLFKNQDINKNGAQLLFTSHDLTTMNSRIFRRDEIWFSALNLSNESEIYSLYDIRTEENKHVNNTASYSRQYLEGRYGADPYLRAILDWRNGNES